MMNTKISVAKRDAYQNMALCRTSFIRVLVFCVLLIIPLISIGQQLGIAISIDSIRIQDEDDPLSNDEPYLIVTKIAGRIASNGVEDLQVDSIMSGHRSLRKKENWANEGKTYRLSEKTPRVAQGLVPANQSGWIIGAIVVHMEKDGFSRRAASTLGNQIRANIRKQLRSLDFRDLDSSDISSAVASEIGRRLERDLKHINVGGIIRGLTSAVDPDDYGGYYAVLAITGPGNTVFSFVGQTSDLSSSSSSINLVNDKQDFTLRFPVRSLLGDVSDNARFKGKHRINGTIKVWTQQELF